jgi:hypothetical protein
MPPPSTASCNPKSNACRAHSCIYNSAAHTAPIEECYVKAIAKLKMDGFSVPPDYEENFRRAYLTFQHQRVYHPEVRLYC